MEPLHDASVASLGDDGVDDGQDQDDGFDWEAVIRRIVQEEVQAEFARQRASRESALKAAQDRVRAAQQTLQESQRAIAELQAALPPVPPPQPTEPPGPTLREQAKAREAEEKAARLGRPPPQANMSAAAAAATVTAARRAVRDMSGLGIAGRLR